jgi:hypothetical protein
MLEVMFALFDACRRHRIPIGLAPNIEVSLVVNPDDAALLAPRDWGFYRYELWRRALRVAARPLFASRMRPRARRRATPTTTDGGTDPVIDERSVAHNT